MGFETIILLFVVFSLISSVASKVQEYRRRQEGSGRPRRQGSGYPRSPRSSEPEIGPADWEILLGSEAETEPEIAETGVGAGEPEFRPVRGTRPVEEPTGLEEFQEVEGTRPVTEPPGGEEFREVRGTRQVEEGPSSAGLQSPPPASDLTGGGPPGEVARSTRRRIRVPLAPRNLRQAIIYQEILGKPRADTMPW